MHQKKIQIFEINSHKLTISSSKKEPIKVNSCKLNAFAYHTLIVNKK